MKLIKASAITARRRACISLAALAFPYLMLAAGSVDQTTTKLGSSDNWVAALYWHGDAVTGAVPTTTILGLQPLQGWFVSQVEVIPGSPTPTDGYSVQVKDQTGIDQLAGAAIAASSTLPQFFAGATIAAPINGALTLVISGQHRAGAQGTVLVYIQKPTQFSNRLGPGDTNGIIANWLTLTNSPVADPRRYDFTAQAPGGTLTAATPATVLMAPCPIGVSGTDTHHYLYVSSGTGTPEAVLITGGSCVSAAASGTVQFTPANSHSGSWTVTSATAGIQEAKGYLGAGGGIILLPANAAINLYCGVYFDTPIWLLGQGVDATKLLINNTSCDVITAHVNHVRISGMYIDKAGGVGTRTGNGIVIDAGTVEGVVEDVRVYNQNIGVKADGAEWIRTAFIASNAIGLTSTTNELHVIQSQFNGNTQYGVSINGGVGLYFTDTTMATNGISGMLVSGLVGDLFMVSCTISGTTSGPALDLNGASTNIDNFRMTNGLIEAPGANQPAVSIGNVPGGGGVHFDGVTIGTSGAGSGIVAVGSVLKEVSFTGCEILGSGTAATAIDISGVPISAWVTLTGNLIKNWVNGFNAGSNLATNGFTMTGNYFQTSGDPLLGTFFSALNSNRLQPNFYAKSAPTYAGASNLSIKAWDELVFISGTTPIATLNEVWENRTVTLVFTDAAPGGITTGGNITSAATATQFKSITLRGAAGVWWQ